METESLLARVRQEIESVYIQKYGRVDILFEEMQANTSTVRVRFVIKKVTGFVTRYYGTASYEEGKIQLRVRAI